jgi:5'-nucleotidase
MLSATFCRGSSVFFERRRRVVAFTLVSALLLLPAIAPAPAQAQLEVLLTGDDGFDAPGLRAMRDALLAAGHRVTVVAPLDDRSGTGSSVTMSGMLDYYPQAEGVWAVDGTPSDAVTLALVHVMRASPPDLVISGANLGHTVGADVIASGTAGAALTAARAGYPAIAVSVAADAGEAGESPAFPSTTAAFAPAAALVVEIARQLAETGGTGLLAPRTILNVNYPAVGSGEPAGVRFASVSSQRAFRQLFSVAGASGPARVQSVPGDPARAEEGSDFALLMQGYVTISVLDGNLDAGEGSWEPLLQRLIIER